MRAEDELLALVEELIGWLRVDTFDERDGEREMVVACYRRTR